MGEIGDVYSMLRPFSPNIFCLVMLPVVILVMLFMIQYPLTDITPPLTAIGTIALAWFGYKSLRSNQALIRDNQVARQRNYMIKQLENLYQPLYNLSLSKMNYWMYWTEVKSFMDKMYLASDKLNLMVYDTQRFINNNPVGNAYRNDEGELIPLGYDTDDEWTHTQELARMIDDIISVIEMDYSEMKNKVNQQS